MLSAFDKEFKNVTNYLKKYTDNEVKTKVLEIYKTLDDVFNVIDTYDSADKCDLLVQEVEKQFKHDLKKSQSYKDYQRQKIENVFFDFTQCYSHIHKYKTIFNSR